ncbi:histidine kinase [Vibrio alginolyticus]|nr:histidine kinase [Vibrio alginolyticus]
MKNKNGYSIKKRLTVSVVMLSSLLILISLYFSYSAAQYEINEVYDARLGQSAKLLLLGMPVDDGERSMAESQQVFDTWMQRISQQSQAKGHDDPTTFGHPYEKKILFQFYRNGLLIWGSNPEVGKIPHNPAYVGFGDVTLNGESWRFFQLPLPENYHTTPEYVIVAEKQVIRQEMSHELALSTALPQLILIPCLAGIMVILIGIHFEPISELKRAITQRSVNKLDSIYVANPTVELSPLVTALNELLSQLDQAWQREKRFTRMAAHELKTPLTVLRLNAENALNSQNEEQLKNDLNNILRGIERTDRLIQQLLMLAKVESQHPQFSSLDLRKLLQNVIAQLVPITLKQKQEISLQAIDVQIRGDETLLTVLFSNLIDNAIRYSGEGSEIHVVISDSGDYIEVRIADNGPEIDTETREKLFDNFYRANTEKGDGAGLGMSITQDIAKSHQGRVELLPREHKQNVFLVRLLK